MVPTYTAGDNIAMKVPVHEFDQTVAFYRDIIALKMAPSSMGDSTESAVFQ